MSFEPKTVIEWYKKKPKWARRLLFIVVVFVVVLAGVWWVLTQVTSPRPGAKSEPLATVTEAFEKEYREDVEETIAAVEQNNEEIEDLHEERVIIEEQREEGMKQNEREHERIDGASDAASVVAAMSANRGRRRTDKTD